MLVQRYAEGALASQLAAETGLDPEELVRRIQRVAVKLGYEPPASVAWLRPNGQLASHAARQDLATGCLVWTGRMGPREIGPYAYLPQDARDQVESTARKPQVSVRRFLWERSGRSLTSCDIVVATCGNVRCINLGHAEIRPRYHGVSVDDRATLVERKAIETRREAAARLGIDTSTVNKYRGGGGKRTGQPSEIRDWLRDRLPAAQPARTHALDWAFAQQYATGATMAAIGKEHGVSRQMVHMRITRLARVLGWSPGSGN